MANLPTGTVTFLFTDIEGSTRLLGRLGDIYPALLQRHHEVLRRSFRARGGIDVSTEGDAFFVVFPAAREAVAAAVEALRLLAAEEWPGGEEVRVRVGLHTGEGALGGDNYIGVDVNRAARISGAAHGGQILISSATHGLLEHAAPEGITFRDLGEHRLKDLPRPERLYQVLADGIDARFPALRALDARLTNLPPQLTTFVGRDRELEEVTDAVRQSRLVTLTGPGGTGKTRLSIQAGAALLGEFEDGVWFVPLAPITDPSLVMPAVADAFDLHVAGDRMPVEQVIEHLRDRRTLVLLDNTEQVLEASGEIGQVLTSTEGVHVLATSREPLALHGEREYPVPPLELPDPLNLPSLERLSHYAAVELFVERATGVKPAFSVTNENAPAVAEICARLDGLPLAIELAAARVKLLSPQEILKRLEHSLAFLSAGSRDRPARQQTLRDAIAWSFDLLDDAERSLFAELSVFAGGFALDAAEAVCGGDEVFEGVASLVNKSLIRQSETPGGESRFLMLETIREFAGERLAEAEDADEVRRRHVQHHLELARRAAPNLFGAEQARWLSTLGTEHENFRAALRWAGEHDLDLALRLASTLWRFWQMRGHLREGREVLERLLDAAGPAVDAEIRADALEAAGGVAYWMGDTDGAQRHYGMCLDLRRQLGNRKRIAEALYNLTFAYGIRTDADKNLDLALGHVRESLDLFRELGDEQGTAKALWGLGDMLYEGSRPEEAEPPLVESLEMHRRLGNRFDEAWALFILGLTRQKLGRGEEAARDLMGSLDILAGAGDASGVPLALGGLAAIAAEREEWERAIVLAAAAQAIEEAGGGGLAGVNEQIEGWEDQRRGAVAQETYDRLWERGSRMSVDEAVAYAREPRA